MKKILILLVALFSTVAIAQDTTECNYSDVYYDGYARGISIGLVSAILWEEGQEALGTEGLIILECMQGLYERGVKSRADNGLDTTVNDIVESLNDAVEVCANQVST